MNLRQTFGFAFRGVTANKLRSALTTLGILIGVAAVIVLVAVGTGSSKAIQDQISSLGSNTLTVTSTSGGTGGRGGGGGFGGGFPGGGGTTSIDSGTQTRAAELTLADADSLTDRTDAPDVISVAPTVSASSVVASYDGATHTVSTFTGTSPNYLAIDNSSVRSGASFTNADYDAHRRVALLGSSVAEDLVGGNGLGVVGKTVQLDGVTFTVLGVLADKGSTGPQDSDDRVIAPLTTVQDTLTGYAGLASISVKAGSADTVEAATAQVEAIMNVRHKIATGGTADYSVSSSSSILSAATSSNQTFTVLLGAVAAISLLVGGIGVMNIMLVTVTERTREIGIRKAIGARRGDIVGQFLFEAVLLSVFGGLTGVAAGLIGSRFEIVGVQPVVEPYSVALAFGVAVGVGLFFGLYPANRAAALRPIDALRYE